MKQEKLTQSIEINRIKTTNPERIKNILSFRCVGKKKVIKCEGNKLQLSIITHMTKTEQIYGNRLRQTKPYKIAYAHNGELDSKEFTEESAMHAFYKTLPTALFCQPTYEGRALNWKGQFYTPKQIAKHLTK